MVGYWSALMGVVIFRLFFCPQKLKMKRVRVLQNKIEQGCDGKLSHKNLRLSG